jgi:hypothetical protein
MTDRPDLTVNAFTPEEPPPMKIDPSLPFSTGNSRIPEEVREQWKKAYRAAFDEVLKNRAGDHDPRTQHQVARQKANEQVLQARHPQTYDQALALPDWQVLTRRTETKVERKVRHDEEDGPVTEEVVTREIVGVTIDGKGFRFAIPERRPSAKAK